MPFVTAQLGYLATFLTKYPGISLFTVTIILVATGFFGAYCGAYLIKKAETRAINEDFDNIVTQLATQTEVTKKIESEISHNNWLNQEWKTIRRTKLEDLLTSLYELRQLMLEDDKKRQLLFLDIKKNEPREEKLRLMLNKMDGYFVNLNNLPTCGLKSQMLAALYFAELENNVKELLNIFSECQNNRLDFIGKQYSKTISQLETLSDNSDLILPDEELRKKQLKLWNDFNRELVNIISQSQELIDKIYTTEIVISTNK